MLATETLVAVGYSLSGIADAIENNMAMRVLPVVVTHNQKLRVADTHSRQIL
nr:hypothetical protein [uncultured Duncaniella sp.]